MLAIFEEIGKELWSKVNEIDWIEGSEEMLASWHLDDDVGLDVREVSIKVLGDCDKGEELELETS